MFARLAGCLAAVVVLCGCDPISGVMRNAELASPPEPECVRLAIEGTPGVTSVKFLKSSTEEADYSYLYSGNPGNNVSGAVQIRARNGKLSYSNSHLSLGAPPAQADIDATRPVMRAMEKNIARQCGITELASGVRENCTGVACNPLPN
jgi:hypothetical protein